MFSPETAEIFGNDAVDLARFHIRHHALEIQSVEVRFTSTVIYKLGYHMKSVISCVLPQDSVLRFDGNTVAIIFIITTESHIECGVVKLFHKLSFFA